MDKVSLLLKAFVIGSGVLLVIGTITLVVLVALGIGGGGPPATVVAPAPLESSVALPAGARIDQVVPDPVRDRVLLLGTAGDGSPFLALIDPDGGRLVGLIRFRSEAGP